jgi:hypothetical protein
VKTLAACGLRLARLLHSRPSPDFWAAHRPQAASRNILIALLIIAAVAGCNSSTKRTPGISLISESFIIRVTSDPVPPHARERNLYKVVVLDRKTNQPIENGEGRIFATSRDAVNVWDGLAPGPEVGTYYGTLNFITAGDWAVAVQFRRDSTQRLERVDWMQDVRAERESTS